MKEQNQFLTLLLIIFAWSGVSPVQAATADAVVGWGDNEYGQTMVPVAAQSGVTAIAAAFYHTVALKTDGSVVAWGDNDFGETTVPGAARSGVKAVAAGEYHTVALKTDGSVVAWGYNGNGQTTVPVAAQSGVTAIEAGEYHTLALKTDGSAVAWGLNDSGQATVPFAAQSGVTAIAAGDYHSVALKTDGSVVAWGLNDSGRATIPVVAQSGVMAIAAGSYHTVALKTDGSVVAWGNNGNGQTTVPLAAQSGVTAIAAGYAHTVALKTDGSVVAWGSNGDGQATVPAGLTGVRAIAAGRSHTVALVIPPAPTITTQPVSQTVYEGQSVSFTVTATSFPLNYQWRRDGFNISGATGATYNLGLAQTNQAGGYTVVVSNSTGSVTSAPPAVLTVNPTAAPTIITQPASQTVYEGQSVSFTVTATSFPLNYQWRRDGFNISGATGATYNLGLAQTNQAGGYTVVVSNFLGSVTSAPPALLAFLVLPAVTEAWVHRYSNVVSNSNDQAFKVLSDADGDMIVTGVTLDGITGNDFLMIKYSGADGSVLWQKRSSDPATAVAVDGSRNVVVTGSSGTIKYLADGTGVWTNNSGATALAVDGSGNVLVTGASGGDFYTAKYATADGALLWEKRSINSVQGLVVDSSGNAVVWGHSVRGFGRGSTSMIFDYYLARYAAADGALVWEKRADGPVNGYDFAQGFLAVDGTGNVVVMGPSSNATNNGVFLTKYAAADGAFLWEKPYNGMENGSTLVVDGNGNVVVAGYSSQGGDYNATDYYTAKYAAADGTLLWEKHYNGPANSHDSAQALAVDGNGNVVVTGFSYSSEDYGSGDYYTAKYAAADGALLWEKRYNGPASDHDSAHGLTVDASGNVVVTGSSATGRFAGSEFISDFYTAKYAAADGALLWEKRYNGLAYSDGDGRAVAVDASGNVVVTGNSVGSSLNSDYYTAKYAAASGALLWEKRYNGPGDGDDAAHAVVVDDSDNVVVTGSSRNSNGNDDYYTAKYASADGTLLWEKRYNGTANSRDAAHGLAVDGSGNVVVTGSSATGGPDSGFISDFYTAKYAAADGALLWEKRYNGTGNRNDRAQAVTMDGSGNVVVTGYSDGNVGNVDYYTAKYASADGALLWERRYNSGFVLGYGSDNDFASALAVDASGNVVVTGYSYGASSYDYYTAKYAAGNGALLWEKRYDGPGSHDDRAQAVAVDSNGNVVVTGMSGYSFNNGINPGSVDDYYTAKYAAADGALLWEKRYDPANFGQAHAVAVDDSDNVVVTGTSYDSGSGTDYYTAKYAAADGALLWEKRYNGPANGDDYMAVDFEFNRVFSSRNLALGPNGVVAITGSSRGAYSGIAYNYATVVYREGLSPLSLERVPAGVRIRFAAISGRSYTIERAPAVTGPWSAIATSLVPIDGVIEYVDINGPSGVAFYRTSTP